MIAHPKEMQEFRVALQAIQPIMFDSHALRKEKRDALCMMVEELSVDAFQLKSIAEQIMTIINMKEEVCREYPDSEAQTEGILEWLPRMKQWRNLLLKEVRRNRECYGLAL